MATISFEINRIDDVRPNWDRKLEVECDMTRDQMRDAFGEFLEHISDKDFAEWVKHFELEEHFKAES